MAVSKRLRYEVLRRDNYTCRYCGKSAPEVVITVDHVIPRALGGSDEPSNLCAACRDCNGGKTSSSPDAPLVDDVAEDALRWSAAMQAAASRMLADLDARAKDHAQFEEWWDCWTYGSGDQKRPVPKDPGWEHTVNQLLAAGLPLRVLKDCIDLAMTRRKIKAENTFRYMCGIAWNKVGELHESAKAGVPASGGASDGADWFEFTEAETRLIDAGRRKLADELLGELTENDREIALDEIRSVLGGDVEVEILAASTEFYGAIRDRDQLTKAVQWFLERHPDGGLYLEKAEAHLAKVVGSFSWRDLIRVAAVMLMDASQPSEVTS